MEPKVKKLVRKKKRRPADRDSSGVEDEDKTPVLPTAEESKATPKVSPRVSPKASPKQSPAVSPKTSPKTSPKVSPKSGPSKEPTEDPEYKALAKEAVRIIETEISKPDAQKGGKAFIPADWSTKFKKVLGAYRKFVNKNSTKFTTYTTENSNFVIVKAGSPPPDGHVPNVPWKKALYDAWIKYCNAVPKAERDFKTFCEAIPASSMKVLQKSPKASPKVSPDSAPASPKGTPGKVVKKVKKVKKVAAKKK